MGTNRLIYIRTDGNSQIASGHLVRCLSIAVNCLKKQMKVCFLLSDTESKTLLESFLSAQLLQHPHFSIRILKNADYHNLEKELPEVISLLQKNKSCIYLLDSYFVTERYLLSIKEYTKIAYLDDLMCFDYPVNLLINYDIISPQDMSAYQQAYTLADKKLLGASYAPLRSQFEKHSVPVKDRITDILITTGAGDPCHFILEFLRSCTTTDSLFSGNESSIPNLHIVIGKLNTDSDTLSSFAQAYPYIILHKNVTDMASLMRKCDFAISAAGTTLYELCALGIPTISFSMADNQITCAQAFAESGAIVYAGDIRTDKELMLKHVFDYYKEISDIRKRENLHLIMQNLVDGNGAARIAEELSLL